MKGDARPVFEIPENLTTDEAAKLALRVLSTVNKLCNRYGIPFMAAAAHSGGEMVQSFGNAGAVEGLLMIHFMAGDCARHCDDGEGDNAKH